MIYDTKAGFVDENVTYEKKLFWGDKYYKEKLSEKFDFCLRNRNGRNVFARIAGENFYLISNGTVGKVTARRLFKWELYLNALEAQEEDWHTVCCDAEGKLSFYDGNWIEEQRREELEKAEARKTEEAREVERIVELATTRYSAAYELIQDKEFFLEQLRENIYDYLEEEDEEILDSAQEWFDHFLKGERELPAYIKNLTYESLMQEYPQLGQLGLSEEEGRDVINAVINEMQSAESWGPWTTEYKEQIYWDFEDEVNGSVYEKQTRETEKIKEAFIQKYPIEKLVEMYSSKTNDCENTEEKRECIERALKEIFASWRIITDETFVFQELEKKIDDYFLLRRESERKKQELNDFYNMWGDEKIIVLTPEKRAQFLEVESGKCTDSVIINEYNLYQKLLAEYEELVYRKNKKGLKPTFAAIPAYFDHFLNIAELAKKYHLIDEEGVFLSWNEFDKFNRAVRKYEKSLA